MIGQTGDQQEDSPLSKVTGKNLCIQMVEHAGFVYLTALNAIEVVLKVSAQRGTGR